MAKITQSSCWTLTLSILEARAIYCALGRMSMVDYSCTELYQHGFEVYNALTEALEDEEED